jgi:hypothetical protein
LAYLAVRPKVPSARLPDRWAGRGLQRCPWQLAELFEIQQVVERLARPRARTKLVAAHADLLQGIFQGLMASDFRKFCMSAGIGLSCVWPAAGRRPAIVTSIREPLIAYLLVRATMLRDPAAAPAASENLSAHARALELLATVVRGLPEDDERLLMLGTLAVREGQFVPGPATEHALGQFSGTSAEDCEAFLTDLSRVARDDSLARARERGFLPPQRPI